MEKGAITTLRYLEHLGSLQDISCLRLPYHHALSLLSLTSPLLTAGFLLLQERLYVEFHMCMGQPRRGNGRLRPTQPQSGQGRLLPGSSESAATPQAELPSVEKLPGFIEVSLQHILHFKMWKIQLSPSTRKPHALVQWDSPVSQLKWKFVEC